MAIKKCDCKHKFQDAQHGDGNRAHNPTKKNELRCTVCGRTQAKAGK